MPETETTVTAEVVDEMPATTYGRTGKWTTLVSEANSDGKVRKLSFAPPLSAEDVDKVRRQLSHTAASLGRGVRTTSKDEDGATVVYFHVVDKRPRTVADSGASGSTPASAAPAPSSGGKAK